MPNKKDVIKLRNEQGVKVPVPKRHMSLAQAEAYKKFKLEHTTAKIGHRLFDTLKPKNVRSNESSRITCLCVPCQNIQLKTEALNKIVATYAIPKCSNQEIVDLTLCDYSDKNFPKAKCLTHECRISNFRREYEALANINNVEWYNWEYANIEINNEVKRKIKLQKKTANGEEFIKETEKELHGHAEHLFRAQWQQKEQKNLRDNLKDVRPL